MNEILPKELSELVDNNNIKIESNEIEVIASLELNSGNPKYCMITEDKYQIITSKKDKLQNFWGQVKINGQWYSSRTDEAKKYNPVIFDTILIHEPSCVNKYPRPHEYSRMKYYFNNGEFTSVSGTCESCSMAGSSYSAYDQTPKYQVLDDIAPLLKVAEHLAGRKLIQNLEGDKGK